MNQRYKYTKKDDPKKRPPTSTAHQVRVPIFLPVNQVRSNTGGNVKTVNKEEWVYHSQHGVVTVRNHRLTQEHKNIVEVILTHYKPIHIHSDGSWEFQFTLYDLQKNLQKKSKTNNSWIRTKLDELQGVQFIVEPDKGIPFRRIACSVLNDHCISSENTGQTGEYMYTATFNRHYMRFFDVDTHLHTEKLTDEIIALNDSAAQALVRYCLSHKSVNMKLNQLLDNIGISTNFLPASTVTRTRRKILETKEQFEAFGIEVSDEKPHLVSYKQHSDVWFRTPGEYNQNLEIGSDTGN